MSRCAIVVLLVTTACDGASRSLVVDGSTDAAGSDAFMDSTSDTGDPSHADAGVPDAAPCPGTQAVTLGSPPPNDVHCFNDFACKPPLVQVSCVETCNGDTSCLDAGQTWYVTVTCGCPRD